MKTRRSILKAVPFLVGPTFAAHEVKADKLYNSKELADMLADCLETENGGKWRVSIDTLDQFVLISKDA